MMKQYFQRELDYLRQAGRAFSKANPGIAPQLGEVSADPDVERLLEGFAFLTAQIQQQSDAWAPDLAHDLLHVVAPEMQRPAPSQTIVQLTADRRRLRSASTVPAGFALDIATPKGEICRFRTTLPCVIGNLDRLICRLDKKGAHTHTLTMQADVFGPQGVSALPGTRSSVFISGNYGDASNLLLAVLRHTKRLTLTVNDERIELDPQVHVRPAGAVTAGMLNKHEQFAPAATQRMCDYFSLPQASLFFDIVWPTELLEHNDASALLLTLNLDGAHGLGERIDAEMLKLHCVPAINLFEASAIPTRLDAFAGPQLLRPETAGHREVMVYQIDKVEGICDTSFERVAYQPYRKADMGSSEGAGAYYHSQRRLSPNQDAYDTYISIHSPENTTPNLSAQTLSVHLTCTNGASPFGISAQSPSKLVKAGPLQSAMTVCPASMPLTAASANCDTWVLLGHMSSLRPGTNICSHMQKLLRMLSSAFDAHSALGRAHTNRINGIAKLESKQGHQMHCGIATACEALTMHLHSDAFVSVGDAFIFAGLIDDMLADARGINQPHKLRTIMMPSEQTYHFSTRGMGR